MRKKILLAVLLSFLIILPMEVSARGTGTAADPFRIKTLVFDAYFAAQGGGSMSVAGTGMSSSGGSVAQVSDQSLANGGNSISISSNYGHQDGCCAPPGCDSVMAVLRIGKDDSNIIYTQAGGGWSGSGGIYEYGGNGCDFSSGHVDFPWTTSEKCVTSPTCGDCCEIHVSKTFYVTLVESVPPTVTVVAPPTWQNTNTPAIVSCTDSSGCALSSYRLAVYSSNPGTCPTDYTSYTFVSPQTVSSYSWVCAAAKDNEDNLGFSSPTEFLIEKTLPTGAISINNGAATTAITNVTLSLTYYDTGGSGVKDCSYSSDGGSYSAWEACSATKTWTLSGTEGVRTVYYQVRDNAHNTNVLSDTIDYDAPPSVTITGVPAGWVNSDQTAIISCIDSRGCDVQSYAFKTYTSSPPASCPTDYAQYQAASTVSNVMTITSQTWVCGTAKDTAGSTAFSPAPANFSIDKVSPTADITNESAAWVRSNVLLFNCSDDLSGCQAIYYSFVPSAGSDCQTGGTQTAGSITVSSDHNDYVCIRVSDNAGNTVTTISSQLMVDVTIPVTTDSVNPEIWYGSPAIIKLTCSDSLSGCSRNYYCIDNVGGTCTPSIQGSSAETSLDVTCTAGQESCSRIVRYYSQDAAGNVNAVKSSGTIRIDTTLPTCTMTSPTSAYSTTGLITVSWQAASPGSPVSNVVVEQMVDSGTWTQLTSSQSVTGSYPISNAANGATYSFRCKAANQMGVESSYSAVATITVDSSPPTVSVSAVPISSSLTFAVIWSGEDPETGITNYTLFYRAGSSTYSQWQVFQYATSAVFGQDGVPIYTQNGNTYTFKAKAADKAGNIRESSEVSVLVDTVKPNCTIQDMSAYQSSRDFILRWSGTDAESGIKEYVVEQRTGTGSWFQLYAGQQTSKDMLNIQDGIYRFRCRATDNANNTGELSAEKSTTVDISAPDVQITFSSSVYVNDSQTITARVSDSIGVGNVTLYYNSELIPGTVTMSTNQSVWDVTWTLPSMVTTGTESFTITVLDSSGKSYDYTKEFLVAYCMPGDTQTGCKCDSGVKTCTSAGVWSECLNVTTEPTTEKCDGDDDDCNGIVDDIDGKDSINETQCQCYGSSLLAVQNEACNGIDDDCDGSIDENGNCCTNGDTQPCGTDVGICSNKRKTCTNQLWGPCEWEQGPASSETCGNSLDDDCDGSIDEDCGTCADMDADGYGYPASNLCMYTGQDCDDSNPYVNPGAPEECDGVDNNCDGQADEYLDCSTCGNGVQDGNEEGTDCGGNCPACFVWGWLWLTAGGVVILMILAFLWLHMKRRGRDLTWESLKEKWTAPE